jgi:radical SAM superfamily enzyme YgiQ (UPF0313 family)/MoaA/NifB/PqqE/SkfB family radical SAM enzyme
MLRHSYQKLKEHYQEKGLFYTIYRGFKYLIFLIRKSALKLTSRPNKNTISCGTLKIAFDASGIRLYQGDVELTANLGLNVGMCTLTSWTDSSKGDWQVLRHTKDSVLIKNRWDYLPLTLIWHLKIKDDSKIIWKIELEAEEDIKIDAKRALVILNRKYGNWSIHRYAKREFLPADIEIIEDRLDSSPQSLNAWPDADKNHYPVVKLNFYAKEKKIQPLAQQLSTNDSYMHLLGIDVTSGVSENYYLPGSRYDFLYAEIDIMKDSRIRDRVKKDTRVLLLNLPWYKNGRWGVRAGSRWPHLKDDAEEGRYLPFPFFMAYSASLLKQHGFDVHLVDALAEKIPLNQLLSRINKISPDLLVVETSTPSLRYDLALLEKLGSGNFRICLCGPEHNIRNPDFLLNHKFIDYILMGEYEYNLLNLTECISKNENPDKVKGLIYRNKDKIITNPQGPLIDLDTLPWPLREGMPMASYMDTPGAIPLPSVQMLASRGCPFRCKFCLWPQIMYGGNKYRARDVIDVVDEMEYLVKKKGFKSVYFDDDTFNVGKERMLKFCSQIKKRGLENTPWAIMARADLMDEEILLAMKEAGLAAVKYGVESSEQSLLDNCGKEMDLQKAEKMILFTKSLGIKTHLTFTFGLPGETRETIRKTINYALKLKPASVQFSITTPFPGTEYFNELDSKGLVIDKDWDDYDGNFRSVIRLDSLSSKDLVSARRSACRAWDRESGYDHNLGDDLARLRYSWRQNKTRLLFKKIRDNYLDILGIFNGKYAFKGPYTVQIDLTDHCNNNCLACWCNSPLLSRERLNQPKYTLSKELVKNLISQIHGMGTKDIFFSGGGEPFMHPDILEIVEHAKGLGLACAINTNFTLVDEKVIRRLIDLELDNITVSVWAGTPKVYKELHPNKDEKEFHRIYDRLLMLNSSKSIYPHVKIYNVICSLNYNRIREMLEFARSTKSDFIEFTVVDTIPGATDKLMLSQEQRCEVLKQFDKLKNEFADSSNNAGPKIINLEHFLRRVASNDAQNSEYDAKFIDTMPCYVGWLFARIMPNGDVNSCLKSHRFPVGNLYKQSFKEIWNSKKQIYFRKKTLNRRKDDAFFSLIGNDPNCKIGCYKSCDDIGRNIAMHNKIIRLSGVEKRLYSLLAKTGLAGIFSV